MLCAKHASTYSFFGAQSFELPWVQYGAQKWVDRGSVKVALSVLRAEPAQSIEHISNIRKEEVLKKRKEKLKKTRFQRKPYIRKVFFAHRAR